LNDNGTLDRNELYIFMVEMCKVFEINPPTEEDIENILIDLDENGDGELSFEEMLPLLHNIIDMMIEKGK
jgi:Ca2+-binding EF-hand superfamily protein